MALNPTDAGNLALDVQSLDRLKLQAKQAPEKALRQAAQQFETVFLGMMLKTMREATPQDGLFDSEQTKMFTGMLDQQLAQTMASRGVGLADVMVKQLSRNQSGSSAPIEAGANAATKSTSSSGGGNYIPSAYKADVQQDFVDKFTASAQAASLTTGIPAQLILGQAALESGWGKREIKMPDGSDSCNLFGIKAGKDWNGKVAEVTTTEYHDGVASKQVERFRAYDSYTESFQDYAKLLSSNPRYDGVAGQRDTKAFAQGLQQAGYATDPNYANKLVSVISGIRARA
jgi:peptidoglycan hydrolase FlgJ